MLGWRTDQKGWLRAGLLKRQESGKPAFPALKRAFRLLVDGVDDRAPADIAYAFSGYAPLLVRCSLVLLSMSLPCSPSVMPSAG